MMFGCNMSHDHCKLMGFTYAQAAPTPYSMARMSAFRVLVDRVARENLVWKIKADKWEVSFHIIIKPVMCAVLLAYLIHFELLILVLFTVVWSLEWWGLSA